MLNIVIDYSKRKLRFIIYTVGLVFLYGLFYVKFSPWDFDMLAIAAVYTAISKKVVGKSARDNPEGYCGWF